VEKKDKKRGCLMAGTLFFLGSTLTMHASWLLVKKKTLSRKNWKKMKFLSNLQSRESVAILSAGLFTNV
jgi:hypothetical protein